MALKGLKKSEQSSNQDQIDNFIQGASKRIKKIDVARSAGKHPDRKVASILHKNTGRFLIWVTSIF